MLKPSLADLRAFVTVAELRSFAAAAKALHLSQPALSRQIKGLEQDLGETLLVRHAWGVSATPAGEILLDRPRVLDELENVLYFLREVFPVALQYLPGRGTLPPRNSRPSWGLQL